MDKKYEFNRILEGSYGRKRRVRAIPEGAFCQSQQGLRWSLGGKAGGKIALTASETFASHWL
jgi:hypothetical protein